MMYTRDLQKVVFKNMYLKYVGYNPWGRKEVDMTEQLTHTHSLEGLMLKLKLQYFGHLVGRANSLETTTMLGKTEGRRSRGPQG